MSRKYYVLMDLYPSSLGFFHPWSEDIASDAEAEFRLRQSAVEGAELKVSEDEEEAEGASCSVTEGNHFLFSAWMMLIAFKIVYTVTGFRRRESLGFEPSRSSQWQGLCLHEHFEKNILNPLITAL